MPEAAVAAPPPAAPAAAAPPPAPAPSPSPPIQVTPAAIDKGPTAPPPKAGSARERMFQDLRKKAGSEPETKPDATTEPRTPASTSEETTTEIEGQTTTVTPETTTAPEKKGKVSPWKLMEEHKAARLKAEAEIAELRKSMPDVNKVREALENAKKIEERAKALEEEIRFTNFSKSQEFAEKYQKPYEDAWKRWMGELGELTIADPASGQERALAPQDILELVNMPLQKAREAADANFGAFADDVMSARKEIRGLFENQTKALEEAKKMGAQRDEARVKQMQEAQGKIGQEIGTLWKQFNDEAPANEKVGKFFKPVEGDTEINTRLQKGFEISDRAFSVNPLDPRLTPDQRKEIVQLHSAVRNRAAAFGRLVYENEKLGTTVAELKAELAKFQGVQPGAGEGQREKSDGGSTSAKESVMGALRKLAH